MLLRAPDGVRPGKVVGLLLAAVGISCCLCQMAGAAGEAPGFSFDTVRQMARELSAKEFHAEANGDLPDELKKLTYDQYQSIRFRPDHRIWKNDHVRFMGEFFQRGYLYQDPVKIHIIDGGKASDVMYSPQQFDFGANVASGDLTPGTQFGGFRLLYPLNSPQKMDEVAEFLGASYFRTLGVGQRYGSSLRGLAINTAEPSGEEFPRFTEFWLEKPPQLAGGIRVYALLNSPSVAGAYRFIIEPGTVTSVKVETSLFFRKSPKKVGIAPLGSLFLMGQNKERFIPDYRPQVHDADGLQIETGDGAWTWRPLDNPAKTFRITRFPVTELKGFGLLQRAREFTDYDDLQSHFEKRSSYWVEPDEKWPAGTIELVEIPTQNDWNDNIVAYWTPQESPAPGQELHLTYHISALLKGPDEEGHIRVGSTRIRPETKDTPPRFVIDFAGIPGQQVDSNLKAVARIQVSQGQARNLVVQTNETGGGWQVFFDLTGAGDNLTKLRLRLQLAGKPGSETWDYDYQKSN